MAETTTASPPPREPSSASAGSSVPDAASAPAPSDATLPAPASVSAPMTPATSREIEPYGTDADDLLGPAEPKKKRGKRRKKVPASRQVAYALTASAALAFVLYWWAQSAGLGLFASWIIAINAVTAGCLAVDWLRSTKLVRGDGKKRKLADWLYRTVTLLGGAPAVWVAAALAGGRGRDASAMPKLLFQIVALAWWIIIGLIVAVKLFGSAISVVMG